MFDLCDLKNLGIAIWILPVVHPELELQPILQPLRRNYGSNYKRTSDFRPPCWIPWGGRCMYFTRFCSPVKEKSPNTWLNSKWFWGGNWKIGLGIILTPSFVVWGLIHKTDTVYPLVVKVLATHIKQQLPVYFCCDGNVTTHDDNFTSEWVTFHGTPNR